MKLDDIVLEVSYMYAGDCKETGTGKHFISHSDVASGSLEHLIYDAEDIPISEFLNKADVAVEDRKKINATPDEYEFTWNKQHDVLILYDSRTDVHKFYLPMQIKEIYSDTLLNVHMESSLR